MLYINRTKPPNAIAINAAAIPYCKPWLLVSTEKTYMLLSTKNYTPIVRYERPQKTIQVHASPPSLRVPRRRCTLQAMPRVGNNSTLATDVPSAIGAREWAPIHRPIHVHVHIHVVCIGFQQRVAIFTSRCVGVVDVMHLRCKRLHGRSRNVPKSM